MPRIALVGDFDPAVPAHQAIPQALELAADRVGKRVDAEWVGTDAVYHADPSLQLDAFDGIWCVPGSPYKSLDGALAAIHYARETWRPFLGTCGGFQHAVLEYLHGVLDRRDAAHQEIDPQALFAPIARLACPLVEKSEDIALLDGSRIRSIYGTPMTVEAYHCSYGLDPAAEYVFNGTTLRLSARSMSGEVRAIEIDGHPFFIATLFQHERRALRGQRSPLVEAFLSAAPN